MALYIEFVNFFEKRSSPEFRVTRIQVEFSTKHILTIFGA